jgi:hypothetical protein
MITSGGLRTALLAGVSGCWLVVGVAGATVLYVDDDAPLGGDGTSWATAFRYLHDAVAAAEDRDELRVAGGVYRPDLVEGAPTNPQSPDTIWIEQQGLTISGGYAGLGAINPDGRDIEAYETVITGDVNGDDTEN